MGDGGWGERRIGWSPCLLVSLSLVTRHHVTQISREIWGVANVRCSNCVLRSSQIHASGRFSSGRAELACLAVAILVDIERERPHLFTVKIAVKVGCPPIADGTYMCLQALKARLLSNA